MDQVTYSKVRYVDDMYSIHYKGKTLGVVTRVVREEAAKRQGKFRKMTRFEFEPGPGVDLWRNEYPTMEHLKLSLSLLIAQM